MQDQEWSSVKSLSPNVDAMTEKFNSILDTHMSECFSWKKVRRKSNESPWMTDGLRASIKKRLAIFKSEGRSSRWKRIDKGIKSPIEIRKGSYFKRETEKIKQAW